MPTPDETYREGYKNGSKDNLAGHAAEALFGLMKDDPGGHYAAGYRDGAAGSEFKLPSSQAPVRKPAADVNPFDDKVAIKTVCPHCGALDWFEWKFLGRLTDPICGHSWYAGSVTYTLMQIRAGFSLGRKYAKYTTSGTSGVALWPAKAFFWFLCLLLGLGVRLEFGVLMIPIQALAGLFQAKKTASDIVTRLIVLVVMLGGIGFGVYKIQHAGRPLFQQAQQASFNQPPAVSPTTPTLQQNVQAPPSFTLAVNAVNGSVSGLLTMNGQTTALNRDGVEQYALVSFNSIKDILFVQCPQGYGLINYLSSTGNRIQFVPPSANIEILDSLRNSNLTVTCSVASPSSSSPPVASSYYIIVQRCHACAWDDWQKDTLNPLATAGFQAVTGSFRNGAVVPEQVTSWATDIFVGPFTDTSSAQTALGRILSILKPLALANYSQSNLFPDEITDQQANYAGYMTRVIH